MSAPKMTFLAVHEIREMIECIEEVQSEYGTSKRREKIIKKLSPMKTGDVMYVYTSEGK